MDSSAFNHLPLPRWINVIIFILAVMFVSFIMGFVIFLSTMDKNSTKVVENVYKTESAKPVWVFDGSLDESGKSIMKEYTLINAIKVGEQEDKIIILLDKEIE